MSGSREAILGRIGAALADLRNESTLAVASARSASTLSVEDCPDDVATRLRTPIRHTRPAIDADATTQLVRNMEAVQMSVVRLQGSSDVPEAVHFWLESEGIDGDVTIAPALADLIWPTTGNRSYRYGPASGEEAVGVTPCLAAVAETGSVALVSAEATPASLNFLPENHIVVVDARDVVDHVEDVFTRVRALRTLPRALNFVTGPSRTADIEQTIEIGAHGPRRMHVLIVEGQ